MKLGSFSSLFLPAFIGLCILTGNATAHAASVLTQWVPVAQSCPSGYADTSLIDDSDNGEHHVGEEDTDGAKKKLCVGTDTPGINISASWAGSCSGSSFTGLYDDAGVVPVTLKGRTFTEVDGSDQDIPSTHALNEENFRPNDSYAQQLCLSASGTGVTGLSTRWSRSYSCSAGERLLVTGDYENAAGHNLNSERHYSSYQDALCTKINIAAPEATISANPLSITSGNSSTLSWSSTNASSCTISSGVGSVSTSGTRSVSPTQSTTYTLSCTGTGGTATSQVTVTVSPPVSTIPPPPTGLTHSCNSAGNQVTFSWNASSGADNYYLRHQVPGQPYIGNDGVTGTSRTVSITPNQQYDWWVHANKGPANYAPTYSAETRGARFSCASPPPATTVPASPTGLTYSCNANGTSATLSWNSVSGATSYFFRMDDPTVSNQPGCRADAPWFCGQPPDYIIDSMTSRTATVTTVPGRSYSWWVHAGNSAGISNSTGAGFSCPAACVPNSCAATTCSTTTCNNGCAVVTGTMSCSASGTDLTAGSVTVSPSTPTAGVGATFSSTVQNSGGTDPNNPFWTVFQIENSSLYGRSTMVPNVGFKNGASTAVSLYGSYNYPSGTRVATTYSFPSGGTYRIRACVNYTNLSFTPGATETNYNNNCSAWRNVSVAAAAAPATCTGGTAIPTITATPNRVRAGQTSTIAWSATNVQDGGTCSISGPGVSQTTGAAGVAPTCAVPSSSASPTITTQSTYTITCGSATASVLVNVVPNFQEF